MKYITILVAYVFIYIAVDYKRPKEHKFGIGQLDWWVQVLLVTIGGTMLLNVGE